MNILWALLILAAPFIIWFVVIVIRSPGPWLTDEERLGQYERIMSEGGLDEYDRYMDDNRRRD